MGYSQIVFSSLALTDTLIPGAPLIQMAIVGGREIEVRITLPSFDADGGPLTGMTELVIALLKETVVNTNPFSGVLPESLASFAESNGGFSTLVMLTSGDAGALKVARYSNLSVGSVYWVAAVVKDDSSPL